MIPNCNGLLGAGHERMLADLSRMLHQGSVSVIKTPRNGRKNSGGNSAGVKNPADADLRYNAMGWSMEPRPAGKYLFKRGSLADGSRPLEKIVFYLAKAQSPPRKVISSSIAA